MTNQTCHGSLNLCALRVASLTATGAPNVGASKGYCTDASIKLDVQIELEEGAELTQKNGCGALKNYFKGDDKIKAVTLGLELCQLDSELIQFLTGGTLFTSAGTTIGMRLPLAADTAPYGVSVEAWSYAWDGQAQAVAGSAVQYIHWVFPRVKWSLGQFTLEEDLATIPVNGTGSENTHLTVNGPYDDWPAAVANAGGVPSVGGWWDEAALPTTQCGRITVPGSAS